MDDDGAEVQSIDPLQDAARYRRALKRIFVVAGDSFYMEDNEPCEDIAKRWGFALDQITDEILALNDPWLED